MKKIIKLFCVFILLFSVGCEKEEGSKVHFVIKIDSNINGRYQLIMSSSIFDNYFYLTDDITSEEITTDGNMVLLSDDPEVNNKIMSVEFYGYNFGCTNVEIETFVDDEWINTNEFRLGCYSGVLSDENTHPSNTFGWDNYNCAQYCSSYGNKFITQINLTPQN